MNKSRLLILIIILSIQIGCDNNPNKEGHIHEYRVSSSKASDTLSLALECDSLLNVIEANNLLNKTTTDFTYYSGQRMQLILFYKNNVVRKISNSVFDDGGIDVGYENHYFDANGKLFANSITILDKLYVSYFLDNIIVRYNKAASEITILPIDSISTLSKRAIEAKEICDYMHFFPEMKYININIEQSTIPTLKTTRNVLLKEMPDSKSQTLLTLSDNTHLFFLGSAATTESFGNHSWVWYHVATNDTLKGWVFGHPDFIEELNDENW